MRLLYLSGFRPRAGAKHVQVNLCEWQVYIVDTHRLPWRGEILHHRIIGRRLLTDV